MRFRGGITAQDDMAVLRVRGGAASQNDMLERLRSGEGFVAALDQSGGSTPGALKAYGIPESDYKTEEEMFDLVHAMRERIACRQVAERRWRAVMVEALLPSLGP